MRVLALVGPAHPLVLLYGVGMSLNAQQVESTRAELAQNLRLSGWDPSRLAAVADIPERRMRAALAVDGGNPADVWLVRDLLDEIIRRSGGEPVAYSAIGESGRSAAEGWFGIRSRDEVRQLLEAYAV